jgi:hypothetical protein
VSITNHLSKRRNRRNGAKPKKSDPKRLQEGIKSIEIPYLARCFYDLNAI